MAQSSPLLAFLGRLLLAFLYLTSGLQKLQTYDVATGGPVMAQVAPKLDHALGVVRGALREHVVSRGIVDEAMLTKLLPTKEHYSYLIGFAIFLEVAGSLLFVLNKPIGAQMLILFTIPVTLIMHNFWALQHNSPEQFMDMVNAFKNVALVGALLMYLGMRPARASH